ncbi:hypothetical protein STANM309S_02551 [Streptomyces tanashiensis]
MSNPQDDAVSAVTTAQLSRIAGNGLYTSATSIDPAAADVAQALIATLNGSAEPAAPSAAPADARAPRRCCPPSCRS